MNIIGYVKTLGKKTFAELPFNEVDGLIFAELAYINFHLYVPEGGYIYLKDLVVNDVKEFYKGSVDASQNRRLVRAMMVSERFKDIKIGFCKADTNKRACKQFFALTVIMPDGVGYIAYRGTDTTLLGWREDALLAYQDKMPTQGRSVAYVKNSAKTFDGDFYIGGHSKGGNLAVYTALHMGKRLEKRLIHAFSYDGPGFRNEISILDSFRRVGDRMTKYLTTHDVVGVIYNKAQHPKIVVSNGILLGGHDPFYWLVDKKEAKFRYAKERSALSTAGEEALMNWLIRENDESKELAVRVLFDLFGQSNTIYDLLLNGFRLMYDSKKVIEGYSEEEREAAKEIFRKLGKYYLEAYSPKKFIKEKIEKLKNIEEPEEN